MRRAIAFCMACFLVISLAACGTKPNVKLKNATSFKMLTEACKEAKRKAPNIKNINVTGNVQLSSKDGIKEYPIDLAAQYKNDNDYDIILKTRTNEDGIALYVKDGKTLYTGYEVGKEYVWLSFDIQKLQRGVENYLDAEYENKSKDMTKDLNRIIGMTGKNEAEFSGLLVKSFVSTGDYTYKVTLNTDMLNKSLTSLGVNIKSLAAYFKVNNSGRLSSLNTSASLLVGKDSTKSDAEVNMDLKIKENSALFGITEPKGIKEAEDGFGLLESLIDSIKGNH